MIAALKKEGFSDVQAKDFADKYELIHHQPNTATGWWVFPVVVIGEEKRRFGGSTA